MQLTLVRHGECLGQCDPHYYTDPDSPLSTYGIAQAQATAQQLAGENVTHLLSSPLLRALATADCLAAVCNIPSFDVWPELREGATGTYSGISRSRLQAQFPRALFADSITDEGWPHGDRDLQAFWHRCRVLMERIQEQFTHQDHVVLVTHGGCANYLLHVLLGIDQTKPQWFELDNGSITRVRLVPEPEVERPNWPLYPPVSVEIKYVNYVRHLVAIEATKAAAT